ncbi:unnamed protein product, partial [marine sediment metagenome]
MLFVKAYPVLKSAQFGRMNFMDFMGERLMANVDNWLLSVPQTNPGMLEMFRDRDKKPQRDLVPWAGEFSGKYVTAGVYNLHVTQNYRLWRQLKEFVKELIETQSEDGYMGPFPSSERLVGRTIWEGKAQPHWDLWGHYQNMLGLFL